MPNVDLTNSNMPAALIIMFVLAHTVFWMYVGWRAMRAHERIADAPDEALMLHRRDTD